MSYNLFDADNNTGTLVREKPRAATEKEARTYALWLRERRGLPLFDKVQLHTRNSGGSGRSSTFIYCYATFGECLKPSRWENREEIAPVYQDGAYSILIPGHDQTAPRVTMETLDDAGEVIASQTLPVEPKKGGVIWDRAAVRKACGPVPKLAKGATFAPIADAAPAAPEPVQAQEQPLAPANPTPEAVNALSEAPEPEIEPVELVSESHKLPDALTDDPAPATVKDSLTVPSADLGDKIAAMMARLDAVEAALSADKAPSVEQAPAVRPARSPAHERAVRRAWAERQARRGAQGGMAIHARRIDTLETELRLAKDEQALDKQALGEAYARAEQFARRGNQHRERRLASAQRARRMIAAARATHAESINRMAAQARTAVDAARAELAKLKRDMADPEQPERASDIARLMQERDQARTALAAVTARADRQKEALDNLANNFEAMALRMAKAESAVRKAGLIEAA